MLQLDPSNRISAADALNHEYFVSEPLPCSPSELPIPDKDLHDYTVRKENGQKHKSKYFKSQHPVQNPKPQPKPKVHTYNKPHWGAKPHWTNKSYDKNKQNSSNKQFTNNKSYTANQDENSKYGRPSLSRSNDTNKHKKSGKNKHSTSSSYHRKHDNSSHDCDDKPRDNFAIPRKRKPQEASSELSLSNNNNTTDQVLKSYAKEEKSSEPKFVPIVKNGQQKHSHAENVDVLNEDKDVPMRKRDMKEDNKRQGGSAQE